MAPIWLISPRYQLPLLVLVLLFRRPDPALTSWGTVVWEALLAALFIWGLWTDRFAV